MDHWVQATLIAITSVSSALLALFVLSLLLGRRVRPGLMASARPEIEQTVFLFDDQMLVDATVPARSLLEATPMAATDWARLAAFLAPRFDNLAETMQRLSAEGRLELSGRPGEGERAPLRLIAEDISGLARITLIDPAAEGRGILVDGLSQRALEDELDLLRDTLDHAPSLVWREDEAGGVNWANRAYILRSGALEVGDEAVAWPLPKLFKLPKEGGVGVPRRVSLEAGDEGAVWFDCYSYPWENGSMHFALPADSTVRAERALRDFVQTLTKTFADLPIGLAIFDQQRQLQMFNPALLDLTQLGPDFLSARPTLYAFLDRLREARMMPEPKDYRSWRLQMTELEKASAAGFHVETWSLPGGQTYRVTGRPHPNGAVAFLFEDISSEVSLTRRFRAELELGHEVLDHLPDGIAVFQSSGELVMSNAAYGRIWGVEPETTLGRVTLMDAVQLWQNRSLPSPVWAKVRDMANRIGRSDTLAVEIGLPDGARLAGTFSRLHGGAILARFHEELLDRMTLSPPAAGALSVELIAE